MHCELQLTKWSLWMIGSSNVQTNLKQAKLNARSFKRWTQEWECKMRQNQFRVARPKQETATSLWWVRLIPGRRLTVSRTRSTNWLNFWCNSNLTMDFYEILPMENCSLKALREKYRISHQSDTQRGSTKCDQAILKWVSSQLQPSTNFKNTKVPALAAVLATS